MKASDWVVARWATVQGEHSIIEAAEVNAPEADSFEVRSMGIFGDLGMAFGQLLNEGV